MVSSSANDRAIYERPGELLQNLIRFDTTNPPGNEAECVSYIQSYLKTPAMPSANLEAILNMWARKSFTLFKSQKSRSVG